VFIPLTLDSIEIINEFHNFIQNPANRANFEIEVNQELFEKELHSSPDFSPTSKEASSLTSDFSAL
jgi:hypothetical protein